MNTSKQCKHCGKTICVEKYYNNTMYCSPECNSDYHKQKYKRRYGNGRMSVNNISTNTSGAIGELIVSADLLQKGYNVFRSVSPAAECDIIILKDKKLFRIEVTRGNYSSSGSLIYNKHKSENFDIIALYFPDKSIVYIPDL